MNYPLVELHCHLDGSLPTWFVEQKALQLGIIKRSEAEAYIKHFDMNGVENLVEGLKIFDDIAILLQDKESLKESVVAVVEQSYAQGVRLCELRFAPAIHLQKGLTIRDAIEAVCEGRLEALKVHPDMVIGILVCMMNSGPMVDNWALNREVVEVGAEYLDKGVVGIDLAGAEGWNPMLSYKELFDRARELGYKVTIHAGESGPASNVSEALSMHPDRLGHGTHAILDEGVYQELKDSGVFVECCPRSNVVSTCISKIEDHPFVRFYEDGIPCNTNSDDTLVINTSMEDELTVLRNVFKFSEKDIVKMQLMGAKASFCEGKERIIQQLEDYLVSLD
ncbi:MAG: adenosine deaminase family protein [Erysipelotrichaceae bacterium]|nr:adenosine deaminase family protein [Erysipelotrichaceae bacterium]